MDTLRTPRRIDSILSLLGLGCIAAMAYFLASQNPGPGDSAAAFMPRLVKPCMMDVPGFVRGKLYGDVEQALDWSGKSMLCDGMDRPEGQGIRLVFDENADPDKAGLIIVMGVADAVLGAPAEELVANVTIIDQRNGAFYSTRSQPRCWTRIENQIRLTGTVRETWRVGGKLYCAGALPALTGRGSITLGDIEYSGIMQPSAD
jgi:hypothetical protein